VIVNLVHSTMHSPSSIPSIPKRNSSTCKGDECPHLVPNFEKHLMSFYFIITYTNYDYPLKGHLIKVIVPNSDMFVKPCCLNSCPKSTISIHEIDLTIGWILGTLWNFIVYLFRVQKMHSRIPFHLPTRPNNDSNFPIR